MADAAPDQSGLQVEATRETAVVHRLDVQVDADRVARAFDRAYREISGQVRLRGFRPGKVPRAVLQRMYGASVAEQVEQTLVAETLPAALEQSGLEPVAGPAVDAPTPSEGQPFRYSARVETKPAIELPELAGLPAQKPPVQVAEPEVEAELETLRQRHAPLLEEPDATAVAEGHVVSVDFVGRIDDKPFPGGSGRGVEIEIGAGRFLPDFEAQLVGARAGADLEVRTTFPDDYGNAELAGQQAVFAVHVDAVKRREVPELDDEFAKDLGDFASLEALRERIRGELTESREGSARSVLHRTLMDALIERTTFEVPAGLVERHLSEQLHSARHRLEGSVPEESLEAQLARWKEEWRERSERSVREMLLLEAVAEAQGIEVDDEAIEARVAEMARAREVDPSALRKAYGNEALERMLRAELRDERALEFLASQAKVEETAAT